MEQLGTIKQATQNIKKMTANTLNKKLSRPESNASSSFLKTSFPELHSHLFISAMA